MRVPRIYIAQNLAVGLVLSLPEMAANHVANVLRLPIGAALKLFNGQGGEYSARITQIGKREVLVQVEAFFPQQIGSALSLHLGQVISRGERMDYTIQKAVELGVSAITPLTSEYCGVKLQEERLDKKMAHWRGIIVSACEQSGRTDIPVLHSPQPLKNWVTEVKATFLLLLEPTAAAHLRDLSYQTKDDFALLIGSEGGFSEKEIGLAKAQQFKPIQLGPRVLRTETASLAVIAALQSLFGDMG